MNKQQMTDLVSLIVERVYGDTGNVSLGSSPGCGPVKLQIGFVNNIVMHDGVIITDAPPVVAELVMDWVGKNGSGDDGPPVAASPGYGGLFIR
jgi:hypothetical protein